MEDTPAFLALDPCYIERTDGLAPTLAPCHVNDGPLTIDGNVLWTENHLSFCVWPNPDGAGFRGVRNLSMDRAVGFGKTEHAAIPTAYFPVSSDDGLVWRPTGSSLFEEQPGPAGRHFLMEANIFRDEAELNPDRRYKMIWHGAAFVEGVPPRVTGTVMDTGFADRIAQNEEPTHGIFAASSPDMRVWRNHAVIDTGPALGYVPGSPQWAGGDGFAGLVRTPDANYVMLHRTNIERGPGKRRERAVGRWESPDFLRWSPHRLVLRTDIDRQAEQRTPRHDFYHMQIWPATSGYWGIIDVFYWGQDRTHLELAWSPDTIEWHRVCPCQDLVPQAPLGSYGGGCNTAAYRPMVVGDELWVYYGGSKGRHNSDGVGDSTLLLARFKKQRLAGLGPSNGRGEILTRSVRLSPHGLRLNIDASGGSARVALLDENARPIDGYGFDNAIPIRGDHSRTAIAWRTDGGRSLPAQPVRVSIQLEQATLFEIHP